MNRLICLILFLSLAFHLSLAQNIFTVDELSSAIVYLVQTKVETIEIDGKSHEVWLRPVGDSLLYPKTYNITGSGFLIIAHNNFFLVTASHVAKEMSHTAFVVLRGDGDSPAELSLIDLTGNAKFEWKHHKDADVAVLQLNPSEETFKRFLQKRFLPITVLVDSLAAPTRETDLTVIGFPLDLGFKNHFSPLTMHTRPSSGLVTLPRFDNKKMATFFISENPSVAGYSGAPCFDISIHQLGAITTTGNGTKLYGIMHGTLNDQTGGKLGAIVPSSFIFDLLKN